MVEMLFPFPKNEGPVLCFCFCFYEEPGKKEKGSACKYPGSSSGTRAGPPQKAKLLRLQKGVPE